VSLARVGGASLTNNAFDVALSAAKAEASGQEMTVPEIVPMNLPTYQRNADPVDLENVSFKDGTYTVEDAYFVMAGLSEPMLTTVTLDDGIITDASVAFDAQDIQSEYHQRDFTAAYKSEVIGASIKEVPFSRIGGASLTTGGFNDSLQKVMNQAVET
jgi:major membrane immunogen (membrane-anchored lipoprotein)